MRKMENENPFCTGELSNLGFAREEKDIEYLIEWSKKAVKHHEEEKNRLYKLLEPALKKAGKWDKFVAGMADIFDKDDLVNLEYGEE